MAWPEAAVRAGGTEGAVRLVDTEERGDATIGVPQIFHAGAWGTLCDGDNTDYGYEELWSEVCQLLDACIHAHVCVLIKDSGRTCGRFSESSLKSVHSFMDFAVHELAPQPCQKHLQHVCVFVRHVRMTVFLNTAARVHACVCHDSEYALPQLNTSPPTACIHCTMLRRRATAGHPRMRCDLPFRSIAEGRSGAAAPMCPTRAGVRGDSLPPARLCGRRLRDTSRGAGQRHDRAAPALAQLRQLRRHRGGSRGLRHRSLRFGGAL